MTDITYTNKATERRAVAGLSSGKGEALNTKSLVGTIELAASASGATVKFGRIPSNARIMPTGMLYNDDLATSGAPLLDIGLASVDSNITSDPDALNAGLVLTTATTNTTVIADPANAGKMAWEFVSGQTVDPKGELDIYASVTDAATHTTGTIAYEIRYTLD